MANGQMTLVINKKDVDAMNKALLKLSSVEKDAAVMEGLRKGATILKKEVQKNVQSRLVRRTQGSESLIDSPSIAKRSKDAIYNIGYKRPKKKDEHGHIHGAAAHIVSRGGVHKTRGVVNGKIKPRYMSRDAFAAKGEQAMQVAVEAFKKACVKIWNASAAMTQMVNNSESIWGENIKGQVNNLIMNGPSRD